MTLSLSGRWELTTDHAASSYGAPVLLDRTSGEAFGPADIIEAYPSWGLMPAAAAAQRLAKIATLAGDDAAIVARFCAKGGVVTRLEAGSEQMGLDGRRYRLTETLIGASGVTSDGETPRRGKIMAEMGCRCGHETDWIVQTTCPACGWNPRVGD